MPDYLYDVALSFAGSDRRYVQAVADALRSHDLTVFYDHDQQIELWGSELTEKLDEIYRLQSRFVVMFISAAYAEREWTCLERRSALSRAMQERGEYILPARFDDTELPGLRPTVGLVDLRILSATQLAEAIVRKVKGQASDLPTVSEPPEMWEYQLFGTELQAGLDSLQSARRDIKMGFAPPGGGIRLQNRREVVAFLQDRNEQLSSWISNLMRLLTPENTEAAFGPIDEDGDAEQIRQWARAITRMNLGLVDWIMEVRSAVAPENAREVLWALSRLADPMLDQFETFVLTYHADMKAGIAAVEDAPDDAEPLVVQITYTLEIPDALVADFNSALKQYKRVSRRE